MRTLNYTKVARAFLFYIQGSYLLNSTSGFSLTGSSLGVMTISYVIHTSLKKNRLSIAFLLTVLHPTWNILQMVGNARESPFLFNSIYFSPKTNDLIQGWIDWICIFIYRRLKIQCSFFCFWELDSSRHSIYQTKTFGSQFHISLRTYSLSMETVAISRAVSVTHSLRLNSQFHGQCHVTTQIYLLKTNFNGCIRFVWFESVMKTITPLYSRCTFPLLN